MYTKLNKHMVAFIIRHMDDPKSLSQWLYCRFIDRDNMMDTIDTELLNDDLSHATRQALDKERIRIYNFAGQLNSALVMVDRAIANTMGRMEQ